MNYKLIGFLLIIIFVFGYTVFEALRLDSKFADQKSIVSGTVIKTLPEVTFESFSGGDIVDVKKFTSEGDNVFIHFWATWCAPCEAEFPELVEMIQELKDKKDLKFLLVAVNDDETEMKKFLKKFDLNLDSVVLLTDTKDSHKQFGTYKMPETFVFDAQNQIIKKFQGKQPWTQKYLIDYLKSL